MTDLTNYLASDQEQPIHGRLLWLDLPGIEVLYELYTDANGADVMTPILWTVDETVDLPEVEL